MVAITPLEAREGYYILIDSAHYVQNYLIIWGGGVLTESIKDSQLVST